MTAPESPDTPLCAPVAAVDAASGATEPANACGQPDVTRDSPVMIDENGVVVLHWGGPEFASVHRDVLQEYTDLINEHRALKASIIPSAIEARKCPECDRWWYGRCQDCNPPARPIGTEEARVPRRKAKPETAHAEGGSSADWLVVATCTALLTCAAGLALALLAGWWP